MPHAPNPCVRDCPDRRPGTPTSPSCHADCPRYAAWAAARADDLAARRTGDPVLGYLKDASRQLAHRLHLKRR